MNQKPKTVKREIKLFVEGDTRFISLVDHGANKTPFRVIKMDSPITCNKKTENQKINMSNNNIQKVDGKGTKLGTISEVVFKGNVFTDEAAVQGWMEKNNYEGFTVEKREDDFVVQGVNVDSLTDVKEVPAEEGVTMKIGTPIIEEKEPEGDATIKKDGEETPAATDTPEGEDGKIAKIDAEAKPEKALKFGKLTSKEIVAKFDWFRAETSGGKTIAAVMGDADDGLPIGMGEAMTAFRNALENNVKANDDAGIRAVCGEFADVIISLNALFQSVTKEDQDIILAEVTPMQKAEKVVKQETSPSLEDFNKVVKTAIGEALKPFEDRLGVLEATTAKSSTELTESFATIQEKAEKADARVAKLETLRQTRKGADPEGEIEEKKVSKIESDPFVRNAMGLGRDFDKEASIL